jgi:DNA-binding MarR family transcriptional regulator
MSAKREPPNLERVADRLHSVAIHLLRRVRKKDAAMGEGPARISALSVLVFGGPMTLGQLAAAEQVRPPTMSRVVAGLRRSGLVQTVADPNDARRKEIRASRKGIRLIQLGRKRRVGYLAAQLGELDGDEVRRLAKAIKSLERMLQHWK